MYCIYETIFLFERFALLIWFRTWVFEFYLMRPVLLPACNSTRRNDLNQPQVRVSLDITSSRVQQELQGNVPVIKCTHPPTYQSTQRSFLFSTVSSPVHSPIIEPNRPFTRHFTNPTVSFTRPSPM